MAIASATILATLAELGAGKYAMRVVPAHVERQDWGRARSYGRFAVFMILTASLMLAALTAWSEGLVAGEPGTTSSESSS